MVHPLRIAVLLLWCVLAASCTGYTGCGDCGGAQLSLSPTSLDFGQQLVGQSSSPRTVSVQNTGSKSLSIASIAASGDFAPTTACGGPLLPGASCSVAVTFTPRGTGVRTGTLVVADDGSPSARQVGLTGTGLVAAGVVQVDPASLDFGLQPVAWPSAPRPVTLTNAGGQDLSIRRISVDRDYAERNDCPPVLGSGRSCTIEVGITPQATGTRSGTLTIEDSGAGSPTTVPLTAVGVASAPAVSLAPGSLSFGSWRVGVTSASQQVTLQNVGTAPLGISRISTTGDYAQSSTCPSSLPPGASCTVSVSFTPTAGGTRTGTLTIADDAAGSPQSVALSGTGVLRGPVASLSPGSLDFGSVLVGQTSGSKAVTLVNSGDTDLHLAGVSTSGDYAQVSGCGASLAPGGSCTISVTFSPRGTGSRPGTLSVSDDGPGSPQTVALGGVGVTGPRVSLSPASLDFGQVTVGQAAAARTVTLTNTGGSTLHVTSVTVSGDYAQSNLCGSTLAAGAACTIQVTFTPQSTGARPGTLSVSDDAPGSPHTVSLAGTGVLSAGASLSPGSVDFGPVTVGQSAAARTVTLTNTGGSTLHVTSVTVSGDYAQSNLCGSTLAAGAACTIQVTFTPQSTGARSGTLSVSDDAPGSPQTVPLTGVGVAAGSVFPLRVHASGRYLVDQSGTPWRIQADAAWFMSTNATAASVDSYLSTRRSEGFNSFYLMAMVRPNGYPQAPGAPNDLAGHPPFATPNDFSTAGTTPASEAYWTWIDSLIDKAAAQGMAVMLAYTYLGYGGGPQGWSDVILSQSSRQVCSDWGRWLGNRYKNKPNVIWFALGDYTPPAGSELETRTLLILQGIKAAGATQLFMAEPSGIDSNPVLDAPAFAPYLDLNSFYGYGPTGRGDLYMQAGRAYGVSPPRPAWVQEGGYEFENNTGNFTGQSYETRRTRLWSVLAGGTAGDGFGSRDVYAWEGMPASLHTAGAVFSTAAFQLFASLPWWDLRPSGVGAGLAGKTLVTAGGGTEGDMDWVTSAVTSNGSHLLAYIPTVGGTASRTITIDMSAMAGVSRARWWDPSNGASTSIATGLANTGTRGFTSPGANAGGQNDWVLVLESP